MTENERKDKEICEWLGVPWHEEERPRVGYPPTCSCGLGFQLGYDLLLHIKKSNPDFTSEAGVIQLLGLMVGREDKRLFIRHIVGPAFSKIITSTSSAEILAALLITPEGRERFRDLALEWLRKEG